MKSKITQTYINLENEKKTIFLAAFKILLSLPCTVLLVPVGKRRGDPDSW
jgi:hypothetical protein